MGNNFLRKTRNMENCKQRFSIRKFNVGVASVLLGLTFLGVANTQEVKADSKNGSQNLQLQKSDELNNTNQSKNIQTLNNDQNNRSSDNKLSSQQLNSNTEPVNKDNVNQLKKDGVLYNNADAQNQIIIYTEPSKGLVPVNQENGQYKFSDGMKVVGRVFSGYYQKDDSVYTDHNANTFETARDELVKKDNTGLTSKQKALAQVVVSIIVFFIMMKFVPSIELGVSIPGTDFTIHLGYLFVLWIVFWLVGFSNAVNLTDGLDGLSTSTTIVANLSFLIIAWMSSENEIVIFLAILIGAQLGFLIFNKYPAKVFMGDTGSLALGGIVGIVSIMLNNSLLLLLIGIVFVVETASVIIQVISFKTTGKRIFKMTPIHHHFELSGWNEKKIVAVFSLVGAIAGVLGVLIGG